MYVVHVFIYFIINNTILEVNEWLVNDYLKNAFNEYYNKWFSIIIYYFVRKKTLYSIKYRLFNNNNEQIIQLFLSISFVQDFFNKILYAITIIPDLK